MQPSGAQGAHKLLVRLGDARRKRKEERSEAGRISRILSALTCGFLDETDHKLYIRDVAAKEMENVAAPSSRAVVVKQPQSTGTEGADKPIRYIC
jgi:hypothetical protein